MATLLTPQDAVLCCYIMFAAEALKEIIKNRLRRRARVDLVP